MSSFSISKKSSDHRTGKGPSLFGSGQLFDDGSTLTGEGCASEEIISFSLFKTSFDTGDTKDSSLLTFVSSSSTDNARNESRVDVLRQRFSSRLLKAIQLSPPIPGETGDGDQILSAAISENALAAMSWINDLYLKNFSNPEIAASLVMLVSRLSYADAYPAGVTIAVSATTHTNAFVRETGIRAFENWGSLESLNLLKNINPFNEDWLNEYLQAVITDLNETCHE